MSFAANWIHESRRMGSHLAGYVPVPEDWSVGLAVATSACFPPVFNPLPISFPSDMYSNSEAKQIDPEGWKKCIKDLRLTDGGNYDNMGLEPVWKDHAVVLASDASSPMDFSSEQGFIWRLQRYVAIQAEQAHALRKRWLVSSFIDGVMDGAYWGISSARTSYDPKDNLGYPKELAKQKIACIRTDLDAFSDVEAAILENHGYLLADAAVRKHVPELPTSVPPLVLPHASWSMPVKHEDEIREALKASDRRKILGRSRA
jgi:NTE family protein